MEVQQTLGGRYKLLSVLGVGGMAQVWRARDEVLGRYVAIKVLAGRYADQPVSRQRIRDEARAAATLSHPNIAQIYDFGESDENGSLTPYVVMELVHGITLQQRTRAGMLAPRQAFAICGQVAAALAAAHADGLVHRDIKPGNVMVTRSGAKVVDFGIAAAAGPGRPSDELLGTPAYLAPERLTGDAVEPASDVYALGVLLYRLLAGESPWSVESTTQMLDAHVYLEPTPLPRLSEVPEEVRALVNQSLRKNPADRPTATEVSEILSDAAGETRRSADPPAAQTPTAQTPTAQTPTGQAAAGAQGLRSQAAASQAAGGRAAASQAAGGEAAASQAAGGEAAASQAAGGQAAASPTWVTGGPVRGGRAETPAVQTAVGGSPAADDRKTTDLTAPPSSGRQKNRRIALLVAAAVLMLSGLAVWSVIPDNTAEHANVVGAQPLPSGETSPPVSSKPVAPAKPADKPGAAPDDAAVGEPAEEASPRPSTLVIATPATSAGPTSPAAVSLTPSADPTTRATKGTVLTSAGGDVRARCTSSGSSKLLDWAPKSGWDVADVSAGPAPATAIVFADDTSRVRMTVTCVAGVPTGVTLPL